MPSVAPAATKLSRRTSSGHLVHLTVTHRAVRSIWWLILVVQTLNGLQLTFFSYIYLSFVSSPDSVLQYLAKAFLSSPQRAFLATHSLWIGAAYAILSALFVWSTITMVVGSLWATQWSFGLPVRPALKRVGPSQVNVSESNRSASLHKLLAPLRSAGAFLTRFVGAGLRVFRTRITRTWVACGVRGHYFDQAMLVRETIELFYQAVQADQVSRRISHRSINYAYTALIAANALLHPFLTCALGQNPPMRRFAVVFADFFLDFMWGCVLPVWMMWPYLQLDRSQTTLQLFLASGFGSIENSQREVEQLVILSWSALVLSVLPFTSALLSLRSIKKLLVSAKRIESWNAVTAEERLASLAVAPSSTRMTNSTGAADGDTPSQPHRITDSSRQLVPVRTSKLILYAHNLLSLGGVIVACIAIASSGAFVRESDDAFRVWESACRFPLTPWFTTQPACAAWLVNCTQMGFSGGASDIDAAFGLIHANTLVFLSLDSCPQLEVDVSVLQFRNLRALMVRASEVVTWGSDASLTQEHFPVLQTVVLDSSVLPDEPRLVRGFIKGTWGETVEKAIFMGTDITPLPVSDNTTAWANLRGFHCVRCGLQAFPPVLYRSDLLQELVLEGTAIKTIPSRGNKSVGSALWPSLDVLSLKDNYALDTIADDVWGLLTTGSLSLLRLSGTNVSAIPAQVIPNLSPRSKIVAAGSPLCRDPVISTTIPSLVCMPPG